MGVDTIPVSKQVFPLVEKFHGEESYQCYCQFKVALKPSHVSLVSCKQREDMGSDTNIPDTDVLFRKEQEKGSFLSEEVTIWSDIRVFLRPSFP